MPANTACLIGDTVQLNCESDSEVPIVRIQWYEYTTGGGRLISDNAVVSPGHPNAARYSIIQTTTTTFTLQINNVVFEDGGTYACMDSNSGPGSPYRGQAELIVFTQSTNCTTYVPDDGYVLEGQEYTNQCIVTFQGGYAPTLTWYGPDVSRQVTVVTTTQVFSGVAFAVDRSMTTRSYLMITNFTEMVGGIDGVANNAPDLEWIFAFNQLFVYWAPKDMYYTPVKSFYSVGDSILCASDALPEPFYQWTDLGTLVNYGGATLVIPPEMQDRTVQLRCRAQNLIQGFTYEANIIFFIEVNDPPTTPPTTTPPSTTTPPLEADCTDLSGWWIASNPDAQMRLQLDDTSTTFGNMIGFILNGTDTVWVELVGRTRLSDFAYLGVTAIYPLNSGVLGYSAECHRCSGQEIIVVDSMWRSISDSAFCGDGGSPTAEAAYLFRRDLTIGPNRNALHNLPENFKVYQPTEKVTGKLLGKERMKQVAHMSHNLK
jgi:hypothetical protein